MRTSDNDNNNNNNNNNNYNNNNNNNMGQVAQAARRLATSWTARVRCRVSERG